MIDFMGTFSNIKILGGPQNNSYWWILVYPGVLLGDRRLLDIIILGYTSGVYWQLGRLPFISAVGICVCWEIKSDVAKSICSVCDDILGPFNVGWIPLLPV